MLHHIVFFSTRDGADADALYQGLKILEGIPFGGPVQIVRNLQEDSLSREVEFVVYGLFADEAELERYKAHPLYAESIRSARPLRDVRMAADFRLSEDHPPAAARVPADPPPAR